MSLAQKTVAVGDSIAVTIDARALAADFDLQVVIVPAKTPDNVTNAKAFFAQAKSATARQMQVLLTARDEGRSEVRLYYVPHFGTAYLVAARAEITVTSAAK